MIKKKIQRKTAYNNSFTDEFDEMRKEEEEIYLFLRGGLEAK